MQFGSFALSAAAGETHGGQVVEEDDMSVLAQGAAGSLGKGVIETAGAGVAQDDEDGHGGSGRAVRAGRTEGRRRRASTLAPPMR